MSLYCGIDLHSNNHVISIIDEHDKRIVERKLDNRLTDTLAVLEPYRHELVSVAVESTPNWYWLVDGLDDHGYRTRLVNTTAVKQYDGLKYTDDRHDAFWLAHLSRLNILPTGYIYPRPQRAVRDLLRLRLNLTRHRASLLLKMHSLYRLHFGEPLSRNQLLARKTVPITFTDAHTQTAWQTLLAAARSLTLQLKSIERSLQHELESRNDYQRLTAVNGIGTILALTILLETGDIARFPHVGDYASYCRCVKSERLSNDKKKGVGNRRCGNKYLSWAYSEAAHFMIRFEPTVKRFYERKRQQTNGLIAIRATAHKIARAFYHVLRDQIAFDVNKAFH